MVINTTSLARQNQNSISINSLEGNEPIHRGVNDAPSRSSSVQSMYRRKSNQMREYECVEDNNQRMTSRSTRADQKRCADTCAPEKSKESSNTVSSVLARMERLQCMTQNSNTIKSLDLPEGKHQLGYCGILRKLSAGSKLNFSINCDVDESACESRSARNCCDRKSGSTVQCGNRVKNDDNFERRDTDFSRDSCDERDEVPNTIVDCDEQTHESSQASKSTLFSIVSTKNRATSFYQKILSRKNNTSLQLQQQKDISRDCDVLSQSSSKTFHNSSCNFNEYSPDLQSINTSESAGTRKNGVSARCSKQMNAKRNSEREESCKQQRVDFHTSEDPNECAHQSNQILKSSEKEQCFDFDILSKSSESKKSFCKISRDLDEGSQLSIRSDKTGTSSSRNSNCNRNIRRKVREIAQHSSDDSVHFPSTKSRKFVANDAHIDCTASAPTILNREGIDAMSTKSNPKCMHQGIRNNYDITLNHGRLNKKNPSRSFAGSSRQAKDNEEKLCIESRNLQNFRETSVSISNEWAKISVDAGSSVLNSGGSETSAQAAMVAVLKVGSEHSDDTTKFIEAAASASSAVLMAGGNQSSAVAAAMAVIRAKDKIARGVNYGSIEVFKDSSTCLSTLTPRTFENITEKQSADLVMNRVEVAQNSTNKQGNDLFIPASQGDINNSVSSVVEDALEYISKNFSCTS